MSGEYFLNSFKNRCLILFNFFFGGLYMNEKEVLVGNISKVHTTPMGVERITKNLKLDDEDAVSYCIDIILNEESVVSKKGKNYYVKMNDTVSTVNSSSFTIITAHLKKE